MDSVDPNYEYFIKNFDALRGKYGDKFVVIANCEVVSDHDTRETALKSAMKKFQPGEFIIQHVGDGDEVYFFSHFSS